MNKHLKQIALLGSTGSIGTQTLQVISEHQDMFEARVLTAHNNVNLLIAQALKFHPDAVVIANEEKYDELRDALAHTDIKVYAGHKALEEVVTMPSVDIVVSALVGFAGLTPTLAAIQANKAIALANKETLVVAGELVTQMALEHHVPILPVDSEHSAIFQCLVGEADNPVEKILLTASGGPFRHLTQDQLDSVSLAQALDHPTWSMGDKITIDSATLMNKGFEMIEAKWLFGIPPEKIEVVVHPQSVIHSAVQFADGAIKAQLGVPDMRIPIQYALTFPNRIPLAGERVDLFKIAQLTFERPDTRKFPCLDLAYEAAKRQGNAACIMNAANEIANAAFRKGQIPFTQIYPLITQVMNTIPYEATPSLDTYIASDAEARKAASALIPIH